MRTHTNKLLAAGVIACLAGLPAAAIAQTGTLPSRTDTDAREMANTRLDLATAEKLIGADVVNAAGDEVASVQDLILSRSTGQVMYAVVKSGDVLGIGGK